MSSIPIDRELPVLVPRREEPLPLSPTGSAGEMPGLHEAATAFEALFLRSLLRQMLEAQLDDGLFGDGAGSSVYEGMFVDHLSEQLADTAPLGVSRLLESQWAASPEPAGPALTAALERARRIEATRVYDSGARSEPALHAMTPTADPPAPSAPQEAEPPPAPAPGRQVSSAWGWRSDPLDGRRRFHGGIDLPAPAGTPVRSVADGKVVRVGRNGGYGLQVVLDHGLGWTSRYAHLSDASVAVGDTIFRGSAVGRVGSSGRATGPHLHLETARDGIRQDPAALLGQHLVAQVFGVPVDNVDGD